MYLFPVLFTAESPTFSNADPTIFPLCSTEGRADIPLVDGVSRFQQLRQLGLSAGRSPCCVCSCQTKRIPYSDCPMLTSRTKETLCISGMGSKMTQEVASVLVTQMGREGGWLRSLRTVRRWQMLPETKGARALELSRGWGVPAASSRDWAPRRKLGVFPILSVASVTEWFSSNKKVERFWPRG